MKARIRLTGIGADDKGNGIYFVPCHILFYSKLFNSNEQSVFSSLQKTQISILIFLLAFRQHNIRLKRTLMYKKEVGGFFSIIFMSLVLLIFYLHNISYLRLSLHFA